MQALEGVLVVSIEQALAGPLATARLAEAGARVIKVERPQGDFARGYDKAAKGESSYFVWTNQGKESVVLDFKTESDAALLRNIIKSADVLVQNLAPGALQRAGFGSEDMRALNPKLITVDISGYGENPEVAGLKAYDFLVQAEAGLIGISGGVNEMGRFGVSICDIGTGMTAYSAVLEALLIRSKTGAGTGLKISMFDVVADWMTVPLVHEELGAGAPKRAGLRHPSIAPYGAFRTSEGALTLLSIQNEREWYNFCEIVLENPSIAVDARFTSNPLRVKYRDALESELGTIIGKLAVDTFIQRMSKASIAFGAINSVRQLGEHAAMRRRIIHNIQGDEISIAATPVDRVGEPPKRLSNPPRLGQHTDKIRAEFS